MMSLDHRGLSTPLWLRTSNTNILNVISQNQYNFQNGELRGQYLGPAACLPVCMDSLRL